MDGRRRLGMISDIISVLTATGQGHNNNNSKYDRAGPTRLLTLHKQVCQGDQSASVSAPRLPVKYSVIINLGVCSTRSCAINQCTKRSQDSTLTPANGCGSFSPLSAFAHVSVILLLFNCRKIGRQKSPKLHFFF